MTPPERSSEEYWHGKHPIVQQLYGGRPIPGTDTRLSYDVRRFLPFPDVTVHQFVDKVLKLGDLRHEYMTSRASGLSDVVAQHVQAGVTQYLTYAGDEDQFHHPEFWLFPNETIALRRGDCEDGGLLIASCLLDMGIPSWRVRATAGSVKPAPTAAEGGHLWVSYLRESDWEWVALDWCYYQDSTVKTPAKVPIRQRDEYLRGDRVWFSFTNECAYSHRNLTIEGRVARIQTGFEQCNGSEAE